jgi:hypothetical protein
VKLYGELMKRSFRIEWLLGVDLVLIKKKTKALMSK